MNTKKVFFICSIFVIAFSCTKNILADSYVTINIPVANMYQKPDENSSVVSQAIYNSRVEVIDENRNSWILIRTQDDYTGWLPEQDVVNGIAKPSKHIAEVKNLFANIYAEPDTMKHKPLLMVPFSTQIPITKFSDERWIKLRLVDGGSGWIQHDDITVDPKPLTMQQMLQLSRKFLGVPYLWGGTSTYGVDCSGFVQMLYKQMGVILPRDNIPQSNWPGFTRVSKQNLRPGDVLFFGWNNQISHEAVYLGHNKFINSTPYKVPIVHISDLNDPHWREIYITARRLKSKEVISEFTGNTEPIPEDIQQQMRKYTWHKSCPVDIEDLAYLKLTYWGFDNKSHQGVLIVNKNLAPQVLAIFKDLYIQKFPIEKMRPMYLYKGDDDASMLDDNTSAFDCRMQTDFPNLFSIHSYGGAIDINPLINPYVNGNKVAPSQGRKYLGKNVHHKGKITAQSFIVKDLAKYGWVWGGSWPGEIHDYQHFEKPLSKK